MSSYKLAVLDLDFTVWDAGGTWCDHLNPPFFKRGGLVFDRNNREIKLYLDVKRILSYLKEMGVELAVASKTMEPEWAAELLKLHDLTSFFSIIEMYPRNKQKHFDVIQKHTGFEYQDMIFFDDEFGNIEDVSKLGVTCIYVENGLKFDLIKKSMFSR